MRILDGTSRLAALMLTVTALGVLVACGGAEPPAEESFPETPAEPIETGVDDLATHAAVRLELLTRLGIDGLRVDSNVIGGHVTLSGLVRDAGSRALAEQIVSGLPDVASVDNDIVVAPSEDLGPEQDVAEELGQELADELLEATIAVGLLAEIGGAATDIHVEAVEGTVTLSGAVDEETDKSEAVAFAETTEGVEQVIDMIQVTEPVVGEPYE